MTCDRWIGYDRTSRVVYALAVAADALAVTLHVSLHKVLFLRGGGEGEGEREGEGRETEKRKGYLLEVGCETAEILVVGQDGLGLCAKEVVVPEQSSIRKGEREEE